MRVNGHWPILLVRSTKVIKSLGSISLGILWGFPARSCESLLDDLIREGGEAYGASMKEGK
jgi:hypothetical protein